MSDLDNIVHSCYRRELKHRMARVLMLQDVLTRIPQFQSLAEKLPGDPEDYDFGINTYSFDISISGDQALLTEIWKVIRNAGFKPDSRPEENIAHFSTYWQHETGAQVWLSFSSTVCERVKVGTEMIERDVYEVQCK